jgi:hypothetical protein
MSVDKTERKILRELEEARDAIAEYEMFRSWSIVAFVSGLILLATGTTFLVITENGGFAAMVFAGVLFLGGGILGYLGNRERVFWESADSHWKRRVQGPYADLRDVEERYEDYLDQKKSA